MPRCAELRRDRRHERMIHSGAGAMRQHVAGARARRRLQQAGNANVMIAGNGDRLGAAWATATPERLTISQLTPQKFVFQDFVPRICADVMSNSAAG